MYTFVIILFIIISILLILLILLQSSKSSGMELFGSSNQNIFGGQTGDILTKITTVFAALFLLGTIGLAMYQTKKKSIVDIKLEQMKNNMQPPIAEEKSGNTNFKISKTNK